MKRIFGFDLGTTSVGFAVIDVDDPLLPGAGRIQRLGVRIFPEGVEPTGGGSAKAPPNQNRRDARLIRRQLRRKRRRRQELGKVLAETGLLPPFDPAPESDWSRLMDCDPYETRTAAIDGPLPPMEVGRALYHLAKRRGFKGRRPIEDAAEARSRQDEDEEGKVKAGIGSLRQSMAGQTLGAFLAEQPLKRFRPASPWRADRGMIEHELEALWRAQAPHHPDQLTAALKERLDKVIFDQRPTFWRTKTLGRCRLEREAPLCPKGSWVGQRYLMLQRLSNLRFAFGNQRPLVAEERVLVLAELERRPHLTFRQIRKLLKPLWQAGEPTTDRFNFEVMAGGPKQDKTQVPGNLVEAKLVAVFGAAWDKHPERERIRRDIFDRLHAIHYRRIGDKRIEIRSVEGEAAEKQRFIAAAQAEYGLAAEQAELLADWTPPSGWLRLSTKAIEKLLPHLEAGDGLSEAMDKAYPGRRDPKVEGLKRLPSDPRHIPDLRNPTVARTLTELRKVTNNLLAAYGRPDVIRIELARDLKLPRRVKDELDKRNNENNRKRDAARKHLEEVGIPANDEQIQKWILAEECKWQCPYTGRKVCVDTLFRTNDFQIEHIYPASRSFDNSLANKTLCATDENARKRNKTPFEAYGGDDARWNDIKLRLKDLPEAKRRRFLREEYGDADDQDFVARQLNDTAYIAREARGFLARLGLPVEPCNGRVTAQLRDAWGLNKILNPDGWGKSRADHRHHAIDALAVALTTPRLVKRLSEAYARDDQRDRPKLDPPWPTLWAEAGEAVERIVVSHRVMRKVSGPLHDQTALGDTREEVVEKGVTFRFYVTRKAVEQLSRSQIELIRDDRIRDIVKAHVEARGGDPRKACPPYPVLISRAGEAREIRRVRIRMKQQPGLMVPVRPSKSAYADPGENHHMAIFQTAEGKVECEIVSRFEAARRVSNRQPVVRSSRGDGRRFVMSLGIGDVLEFPQDDCPPEYRIITSVWSAGPIVLQDVRDAAGAVWKRPNASSLLRMGARKVRVDPIGRVTPAND